jgi:hypothetical protein
MPNAIGIRAGAAYIELSVSDAKLLKGLQSASKRLKAFGAGLRTVGTHLMAVGGGIVAPLLASAKGYAEVGEQLDKMSTRTGISVEALSELGYAAKLSDVSLEEVGVGVRNMQRVVAGAARGSDSAAESLLRLGLSAQQLQSLSPDQQLAVIAKRLNEVQDPAQRAASAVEIFGRSGTSLLPMLQDLTALRAEARRLGITMSTQDAKAGAALNDALERLWATLRRLAVTIGSALAPLLTQWADKLTGLVVSIRDWLSQNRGLVFSLLKIGVVVAGAGAALTALGGVLSALGTAFGVLASVASAALGFLLSPVGLVTAAVAGLGTYIVWASGYGGDALKWLGERFDDLKTFALQAFQGIKDALAAGDVALAARTFWLSLQVAWQAGINTLKGWWLEFKDWFFQKTNDIFYGAVALVADAWYGLRRIWVTTINFWADILGKFASFFVRTWNSLNGWVAKQWTKLLALFDPSINVEAVNKRIDQETLRRNEKVSMETLDARLGREKELADLETERKGVQTAIAHMADAEDKARKKQHAEAIGEGQAALDRAKSEWQQALNEAKEKRASFEARQLEAGKTPADILPPDLGYIQAQARTAFGVAGTFSAEAAGRMGLGGSAAERTAKASEETAKNTRKIAQQLDQNEMAFE